MRFRKTSSKLEMVSARHFLPKSLWYWQMTRQVCGHERFFGNRIKFFWRSSFSRTIERWTPFDSAESIRTSASALSSSTFSTTTTRWKCYMTFFSASLTVGQNELEYFFLVNVYFLNFNCTVLFKIRSQWGAGVIRLKRAFLASFCSLAFMQNDWNKWQILLKSFNHSLCLKTNSF